MIECKQKHLCEVCGINDVKGVASSPFGAMSRGYCSNCIANNAEPTGDILFGIWSCGGPNSVPEYWENFKGFDRVKGEYIDTAEILKLYPQWKHDFDMKMDEMNSQPPPVISPNNEVNDEIPF